MSSDLNEIWFHGFTTKPPARNGVPSNTLSLIQLATQLLASSSGMREVESP
jgi:hypothetical protein